MKKHLIIVGIICAASIPPAYAVTKCVKLSPSTTCTSPSGVNGQSNWSATCGGIEIQGVAFCGSQSGGSTGERFGAKWFRPRFHRGCSSSRSRLPVLARSLARAAVRTPPRAALLSGRRCLVDYLTKRGRI